MTVRRSNQTELRLRFLMFNKIYKLYILINTFYRVTKTILVTFGDSYCETNQIYILLTVNLYAQSVEKIFEEKTNLFTNFVALDFRG